MEKVFIETTKDGVFASHASNIQVVFIDHVTIQAQLSQFLVEHDLTDFFDHKSCYPAIVELVKSGRSIEDSISISLTANNYLIL